MKRVVFATLIALVCGSPAWADQVILDDLIVDGSLCIGQDCVNGESFGFDTLRLKENNLRIRFFDTSNSGSFPSRDWQITINDSTNGGANKFSIDDIDGGVTPFTIEAGAPSNSLYVDDGGRLGLGTSTPTVDAHIKTGNTPTVRLEQDGSSGFTSQTWDMAGNEVNFFIRDVTNGSKLPFRIRPGAPTSSIDIATDGDVGISTSSPQAQLHVIGSVMASTSDFTSASDPSGFQDANGLIIAAGSSATMLFYDRGFTGGSSGVGDKYGWYADGNIARLWSSGVGSDLLTIDASTGDMTVAGDVTANSVLLTSDVNAKDNITPVDGQYVLAKLDEVPISTWNFKQDESGVRHAGPMAQDFHKAFGLGPDDRHIAPLDVAGVALAGIKELREDVKAKDARIAELETRIAALEALIKALAAKP